MAARGDLYALLIGINVYECEAVRNLKFAVADVQSFQALLEERMRLDSGNCMLLSHPAGGSGQVPRRLAVLNALAQFAEAPMGPDDTFVLYFAGHGFASGEGSYLMTVDSDPGFPEVLKESAIPLEKVWEFVRRVGAGQQLAILDACRNDPTTLSRDAGSACMDQTMAREIHTFAREGQGPVALQRRSPPSRAVLSACWEGQLSYEYPSGGQSWFCHNLLGCLREHPTDQIEVTELEERVRQRMHKTAWRKLPEARDQNPHISKMEGRPLKLRLVPLLCEREQCKEASPKPPEPDPGALAEVVPLRTNAQKAWEGLAKLKQEPTLRAASDEADKIWRNAETFFQQKAYGEAKSAYEDLVARCATIRKLYRQHLVTELEADVTGTLDSVHQQRDESVYLRTVCDQQLPLWRAAAEMGVVGGQWLLGHCYYYGEGVLKDFAEAARCFRNAAEQGYAPAQNDLGICCCKGQGVTQDYQEAVDWFKKAVEQDYASAQNCLASSYSHGHGVPQDKEKAAHWYAKAAEQGLAPAQFNLGNLYKNGEGVSKNLAEAVNWYRKAAEQGLAAAQESLARCFERGEGVPQDDAEAVKWYRKAAEQGDVDAQAALRRLPAAWAIEIEADVEGTLEALLHRNDTRYYQEQVCQTRLSVWREAAEMGVAGAQWLLGLCYEDGLSVRQNDKEAIQWYRKAAEQEYAPAEVLLGGYYLHGTGVRQDFVEAMKWFRKAAEKGNGVAQHWVGTCYLNGAGVPKDVAKGIQWFREAIEQGSAGALFDLGRCYDSGVGVPEDLVEALACWREAASNGLPAAQYTLGLCYEQGAGVEQDKTKAMEWYREAADQGDDEAKSALRGLERKQSLKKFFRRR